MRAGATITWQIQLLSAFCCIHMLLLAAWLATRLKGRRAHTITAITTLPTMAGGRSRECLASSAPMAEASNPLQAGNKCGGGSIAEAVQMPDVAASWLSSSTGSGSGTGTHT